MALRPFETPIMHEPQRTLEELLALLTGTLKTPREWAPVLQLASDTLTIGTLAFNVLHSVLEPQLPAEVRALLVDVLARTTARNERLLGQLSEILTDLNAVGVEPIVMRGMASVLESGPDGGRLMSDIDLLVPGASRKTASEILHARAYQIFQGFHGPPFAVTFGRACDVGMVDLHTNIQPFALRVDYERLAPLCRSVKTDSGAVLLPNPTCALLLYVLHDQLHDGDYWRGLIDARHFADIPRLVEVGVDWHTFDGFFPRGCARNALHVQLRSAKSLLKTNIPEEYCGGLLARLQVWRRRLQLRWPALRSAFTLLSIAIDPPRDSSSTFNISSTRSLRRRSSRVFGAVNAGKVLVRNPRFLAAGRARGVRNLDHNLAGCAGSSPSGAVAAKQMIPRRCGHGPK
jgi:hypothetical protein